MSPTPSCSTGTFSHSPVAFEARHARHEVDQRLDPGARAAGRDVLQELADREKEDDDGRLRTLADGDGADCGDRHQRLDAERRAMARAGDGPPGDRNETERGRGQICPFGHFRRDRRDDEGQSKQGAGADDELSLARPPPRSIGWFRPGMSRLA